MTVVPRILYVVCATEGQWSDRTEWNIAAYSNEEDAKLHVEKAQEEHASQLAEYRRQNDELLNWSYEGPPMKYDSRGTETLHWDSGRKYYIEKLALVCHPDEYAEIPGGIDES